VVVVVGATVVVVVGATVVVVVGATVVVVVGAAVVVVVGDGGGAPAPMKSPELVYRQPASWGSIIRPVVPHDPEKMPIFLLNSRMA